MSLPTRSGAEEEFVSKGPADPRRSPAGEHQPRRVVFLSWRDEDHPEAGGSERYLGEVTRRLAEGGADVTVLTADHGLRPRDEVRDGVRYHRRGGRLTVYPRALLTLLRRRPDVVVDVQNGLPFFARLATGAPVVMLVHHVHREQWPVATGPVTARVGWWVESWLAPRLLRGCRYVTVSETSRAELHGLGVRADDITVVHNGVEPPCDDARAAPHPRLSVVGRLVPHKRVEHAIELAARLRPALPHLHLDVVGEGYWREQLTDLVTRRGLGDVVTFHGHVDQQEKHRLVASSWVHVCPSLKEGWGLVVVEAGTHGVPTVAYRNAGGVAESVRDGLTGLLADDLDGLVAAVAGLLSDAEQRALLGESARQYAAGFSWDTTAKVFASVLDDVTRDRRMRLPGEAPGVVDGPAPSSLPRGQRSP